MGNADNAVMGKVERVDRWQQGHKGPAIALATYKKFSDDQSTNLAALVAFWAFFSIFPLFLVLVTLLGFFLPADMKQSVLSQVASFFPLLNPGQVNSLSGSWWALIVGIATALWSGLGVVKTTETAFNSIWEVPMNERPNFLESTVRAVKALATIGLGLVVSTLISGYVTGGATALGLGPVSKGVGLVIAIGLDVGLFIAAFWMLTDRDLSVRDVLPGALLSGVAFFLLQQLSGYIISNRLSSAQSTYGNFATVITLLWWFYLQAQITMAGQQLNIVLKCNLWPRSLVGGPDTEADHVAYESYAEERRYHDTEEVDTRFGSDADRQAAASKAPRGQTR